MKYITLQIQIDPETINAFVGPSDAVGPVAPEFYAEIHEIMNETATKLEKFGFVRSQMAVGQEIYRGKD